MKLNQSKIGIVFFFGGPIEVFTLPHVFRAESVQTVRAQIHLLGLGLKSVRAQTGLTLL